MDAMIVLLLTGRHAYDIRDSRLGRIVQRRSKEPRAPHELIRRTLLDAEVRFFCEPESHISIHAEKYEDGSIPRVARHAILQSGLEVWRGCRDDCMEALAY